MPEQKIIPPNQEQKPAQYRFSGQWIGGSKIDPISTGPEHFKDLTNMRYTDDGIEAISCYTVLNDTAIATYANVTAGIQLRTDREDTSHLFVVGSDGTDSQLYESTDDIPDAITFAAVVNGYTGATFTDTTEQPNRLSLIPQQHMVYSNGVRSYIYGGNQTDCAGCWLCDAATLANPRDYWETVRNDLTTDSFTVNSSYTTYTVHSTRPLQGVWVGIATPNATGGASTAVAVWTGAAWTSVSGKTDGTISGGISHAQSGWISFDSTVTSAKPLWFEDTLFYAYRFTLSAGSAAVYHIQVDAPFQHLVDIWDGIPREAIYAGIRFSSIDEDFTAMVLESSTESLPIGLILDGLTSTDRFIFGFEERTTGIIITMLSTLLNAAAATLTGYYWDGDSWAAMSNLVDGTLGASGLVTARQSGVIRWTPPADGAEFQTTIGGRTGWFYMFAPSATLTGTHGDSTDSVVVDTAYGIPAQQKPKAYRFHSEFKGRHLACNCISEKESSRIDFTPAYAIDVWNGSESSMGGIQSVRMGNDELTCGMSLFNRYGSNAGLYGLWVGFSKTSIYQMWDSSTEGILFETDKVKEGIGCPAPLTLTSADIGLPGGNDGIRRNVLFFLDASGPYSYDGASPEPIKGIERYFDPNDSLYVGDDISSSFAGFDSVNQEWHLMLPGPVWLVYFVKRSRWYKIDPGTGQYPSSFFQVTGTGGQKYLYAGLPSGEVVRTNYGPSFDGAPATYTVEICDFFPTASMWDETVIKRLKLVAAAKIGGINVEIGYRQNTEEAGSTAYVYDHTVMEYDSTYFELDTTSVASLSLTPTGEERIVRVTKKRHDQGWAHSYKFSVTDDTVEKPFVPIAWGFVYEFVRMDE